MLDLVRYAMPSNHEMKGHGHSRLHVCVVLGGGFEEAIGSRAISLGAGALRLSAPGTGHHLASGASGAECLIIEVGGRFWGDVFSRGLDRSSTPSRFHSLDAEDLAALRAAADDPGAMIEVGRRIAAAAVGEADSGASWLDDLRAAFDAEPETPAICELARAFGRDRVHLARAFRRRFGLRPVEYRALCRAKRALGLLADRSMPLAEAAAAAGYADQSHMSNAMRTLVGASPGKLRAPS